MLLVDICNAKKTAGKRYLIWSVAMSGNKPALFVWELNLNVLTELKMKSNKLIYVK